VLREALIAFGGLIFLVERRAGVNVPKRDINNDRTTKADRRDRKQKSECLRDKSNPGTSSFPLLDFRG
jgi:hypothetical protein